MISGASAPLFITLIGERLDLLLKTFDPLFKLDILWATANVECPKHQPKQPHPWTQEVPKILGHAEKRAVGGWHRGEEPKPKRANAKGGCYSETYSPE